MVNVVVLMDGDLGGTDQIITLDGIWRPHMFAMIEAYQIIPCTAPDRGELMNCWGRF